jgi:hypothetical protein
MTLHSVLEDLRITTLDSIPGSLRKLEYVAGLRTTRGNYYHWGLARVYGEEAAGKALEDEHRSLISAVLATPIKLLLEDVERSSHLDHITPTQYLARLKRDPGLVPPNPGAGSEAHLSSVLDALSSLVRNQQGATHLVS